MRCIDCSEKFVTIKGNLEVSDKILGNFTVPDTEFEQCKGCGEKLYSPVTLKAIEKAEEQRKEELLLKKPLNEFIHATEVAEILNCTRQAVHKHKRIRRGFIHFVKHYGTLYYHKISVELFKETGDGRFQLEKPKQKSNIVSFSEYHSKRQKENAMECRLDASSDSPCNIDEQNKKKISIEDLLEG